MILSSKLKLYLSLGALVAILASVYLGYTHYQNLLDEKTAQADRIARLEEKAAAQDAVIQQAKTAIDKWEKSQVEFQRSLNDLRDVQQDSAAEIGKLNGIFSRHNLAQLAAKKPKLIESRVNAATARSFRMLQCFSGDQSLCSDNNQGTGQTSSAGTPPATVD